MGQPEDTSLSLTWRCVGASQSLTPPGLAHMRMHVGLSIIASISRAKVCQVLEEGGCLSVCGSFPATGQRIPFPRLSGGSEQVGLACRGVCQRPAGIAQAWHHACDQFLWPSVLHVLPLSYRAVLSEGQEASAPVLGCGPVTSGGTGRATSLSPSQP